MKLLKFQAALHEFIMFFSFGMTLVMIAETQNNLYPDVFCLVCAIISLINVLYSAWLMVECDKGMEEIKARERR